jgi:hypothetical protein
MRVFEIEVEMETRHQSSHMTSTAKQIELNRAAQHFEAAHQARLAAQQTETEERARAEIKARLVSVFLDALGEDEVVWP